MRALARSNSKVLWALFFAGQLTAIGLARLALIQPLYAAAVVYAVGFCVLAWNRPAIALALVFAAAPWQQSLVPGAPVLFSLTEVNLALLVPVVLLRNTVERRRLVLGPITLSLLLYFAICVLSSLQTWRGRDAVVSLLQMALYLVIGLVIFSSYARREEDFLPSFYGLIGVGIVLSITMVALRTNYILGLHKNGVGASLACAFLVGVELWFMSRNVAHRRWLLVALSIIAAGLLFSLSRGSWLGAIVGLGWIVIMRGEWKLLFRGAVVFLPLLAIGWMSLPQSEREYATGFGRERWNINERYRSVEYAREHWEKSPVYGVGVGLREEYDATNIAWSTLAETGGLGLVAFALIHVAFIRTMWRSREHLAGDRVLFSLAIIGGALLLRQLSHGMVDHYWGRGPLAMTWAAVGMGIYAYEVVRLRAARGSNVDALATGSVPV